MDPQKNTMMKHARLALWLLAGSLATAVASVDLRAQATQKPAATQQTKPPKAVRVNLNTASKAQLMKVPGIDAALAQKIIDGRPYQRKKDLITKKVVSQATYNTINHQIIVKTPTK